MIALKSKLSILDVSRMMLSLLIISINIREPFFHTREIFFVLVIITSLAYIDVKQLKYALVLVAIWMVSTIFNLVFPGSNFSLNSGGFNTIIVAGYLFLICFSQARYANTIIKSYIFVSALVAIITIAIWLLCYSSESTFSFLRFYFTQLQDKTGLSFVNIDLRAIFGTRFLTVWYRTSPCMICTLGYCLIERLQGNKKYTILILLFLAALILSGTRANMLSAVLLILFYFTFWLSKKKMVLVAIVLVCTMIIGTFLVVSLFLNDSNSASSMIKVSDVTTYLRIYNSDIFRTLFFGWGPGSTFYSVVRGLTVDVTELTLFETVRRYGAISTFVIFFYIWFQPLYILLSRKELKHKLFYAVALFAFIVTACTNPYLLDSVGFCALLFFCVYFEYGISGEDVNSLHVY